MAASPVASNDEQIALWNSDHGPKWVRAQSRLDLMFSGITAQLLKAANVRPGENVLDVGCGCGDTSLQVTDLVGPRGSVTGIDVSGPMLAQAESRAAMQGAERLSFMKVDAATHDFQPTFDLIISRFGVMFFADPTAAFINLGKALKPGGRICFVCWRDTRENEWVDLPVQAAQAYVPPLPPAGPEDPGGFSFADATRVRRILAGAGFAQVSLRPFDTTIEVGVDLEAAASHLEDLGPLSRMLKVATAQQRSKAATALRDALAPFAKGGPVTMKAAVWIVECRRM